MYALTPRHTSPSAYVLSTIFPTTADVADYMSANDIDPRSVVISELHFPAKERMLKVSGTDIEPMVYSMDEGKETVAEILDDSEAGMVVHAEIVDHTFGWDAPSVTLAEFAQHAY